MADRDSSHQQGVNNVRHYVNVFSSVLRFVSFALACSATAVAATIIHVPADQPTIQAGIDAAVNGDTVLVSAGTYKENINFNGKAIVVKSASGPAATIIDGQQVNSVVTFASNESRKSMLSGFTVQNGNAGDGGGIFIGNGSPTIIGNAIISNLGCFGAGIALLSGGPLIQNNVI